MSCSVTSFVFFFNDTATTEIYTLSLHDALPIYTFFVTVRLGEVEKISQAQEKRLGLRLFFGSSSATSSTSDISKGSIARLIDDTCAVARLTAKDEYSGLPPEQQLAQSLPDLDLFDEEGKSLSVEEKVRLA